MKIKPYGIDIRIHDITYIINLNTNITKWDTSTLSSFASHGYHNHHHRGRHWTHIRAPFNVYRHIGPTQNRSTRTGRDAAVVCGFIAKAVGVDKQSSRYAKAVDMNNMNFIDIFFRFSLARWLNVFNI